VLRTTVRCVALLSAVIAPVGPKMSDFTGDAAAAA